MWNALSIRTPVQIFLTGLTVAVHLITVITTIILAIAPPPLRNASPIIAGGVLWIAGVIQFGTGHVVGFHIARTQALPRWSCLHAIRAETTVSMEPSSTYEGTGGAAAVVGTFGSEIVRGSFGEIIQIDERKNTLEFKELLLEKTKKSLEEDKGLRKIFSITAQKITPK